MRVAKAFVKKYESGKLLGFADVIFNLTGEGDGCVTIKSFKIFKKDEGGIQLGMPAPKNEKGEYFPVLKIDIEKPDGKEFLDHLTEEIYKAYNGKSSDGPQTPNQNNNSGGGIGSDDIPF